MGTSPKAKRHPKRPEPPAVDANQREMTAAEITQGYRYLDSQNNANVQFCHGMGEAIDDHAQRLDVLWGMAVRADKMLKETTEQVVENDTDLKTKLASLEAIVTE